jgi:hypothetical protein
MHDTGHLPAYDHEGGVAVVVEDGTDPATTPPDQIGPRVTGCAPDANAAGTERSSTRAPSGPTTNTRTPPMRSSAGVAPNGNATSTPRFPSCRGTMTVDGSSEPATTSSRRVGRARCRHPVEGHPGRFQDPPPSRVGAPDGRAGGEGGFGVSAPGTRPPESHDELGIAPRTPVYRCERDDTRRRALIAGHHLRIRTRAANCALRRGASGCPTNSVGAW